MADKNNTGGKKFFQFGRKPIKASLEKSNSEIDFSALIRTPVDWSLKPLSLGREMMEFLRSIGVTTISIIVLGDRVDSLLLGSAEIPAGIIRGRMDHSPDCPAATGETAVHKNITPEMICPICKPDARLGETLVRLPLDAADGMSAVLTLAFDSIPSKVIESPNFIEALNCRLSLEFKAFIISRENRLLEITDNLTRSYNHRYFMTLLDMEMERLRRYEHSFSLLLLDIDFFRKFNDEYGYQAGDMMLFETAKIIKSEIRVTDIMARYSGQQFAVILTETGEEGVDTVHDKLLKNISDFKLKIPGMQDTPSVTATIGRAVFPVDATISSRLLLCAEDSLKHAKSDRFG